jgi:AcrR family transcriptional regulator
MATREKIVAAAMALFAQQGYPRTSVAQIEAAVGLRPGSGGLYRHFPSKEAVLEAGIEEALAASEKLRSQVGELPTADPRTTLDLVAKAALGLLERDRALTVILFRDLDHFPALRDQVKERWIQSSYDTFAAILRHLDGAGSPQQDYMAKAAVALGSLVLFHVLRTVLDEAPGRVSEARFRRAWLDIIAPTATSASRERPVRKRRTTKARK